VTWTTSSWRNPVEQFHCFIYRLGTDHRQKTHQLLSNGYHVVLPDVSTHALPSNERPTVAHSWLWYVLPVRYLATLWANPLQYFQLIEAMPWK
jgi:hypothetical protein